MIFIVIISSFLIVIFHCCGREKFFPNTPSINRISIHCKCICSTFILTTVVQNFHFIYLKKMYDSIYCYLFSSSSSSFFVVNLSIAFTKQHNARTRFSIQISSCTQSKPFFLPKSIVSQTVFFLFNLPKSVCALFFHAADYLQSNPKF